MIHQGERLSLRFEAGDDLVRIHAQLDDLQCHAAAHRLTLFRLPHHAESSFAQALQQAVTANGFSLGFLMRQQQGAVGTDLIVLGWY
ncbi:MAG: hypothetical protein U1F71_24705 [Verrucomicrobiaceae bacterium]